VPPCGAKAGLRRDPSSWLQGQAGSCLCGCALRTGSRRGRSLVSRGSARLPSSGRGSHCTVTVSSGRSNLRGVFDSTDLRDSYYGGRRNRPGQGQRHCARSRSHRRAIRVYLWPYVGWIGLPAATPGSFLDRCHPRPVNAYTTRPVRRVVDCPRLARTTARQRLAATIPLAHDARR
jgi:hypothetical protein